MIELYEKQIRNIFPVKINEMLDDVIMEECYGLEYFDVNSLKKTISAAIRYSPDIICMRFFKETEPIDIPDGTTLWANWFKYNHIRLIMTIEIPSILKMFYMLYSTKDPFNPNSSLPYIGILNLANLPKNKELSFHDIIKS